MKFKYTAFMALPVIAALSGCADPTKYETEPVQVQTSRGIVTCQLYTVERVLWDRSIHRPEKMTVAEADEYCRRAGQEVKDSTGI